MNKFIKAVLITTILSVVTRALGLFIKIYLSREIGAEGIGYYQIALSLFFLLCSLVTSGIPLVISRKIASEPKQQNRIVFAGLIVSTTLSVVICLVIALIPNIITSIWGQASSMPVLFMLLPSLVFTAVYVPFRGAFWGNKNFFLLGFTELIEQIIRFIVCIIFFNVTIPLTGAEIAGSTYSIACALSSIIAIIIYFVKGNKITPSIKEVKPLIAESAPIAILRIGTSLVSLLISIIFPAMLVRSGTSSSSAVAFFGVVTGMALPIVTIPGTIIGSISVALIPELSGKTDNFITRQTNLSLSYSIIISFFLFPTLLILGEPLGILLFNNATAGEILKYGSFLLLPLGVSQLSGSILNAIGLEKRGLFNYSISAVTMLISILFLPKFIGVYSLVLGFFLMSVISSLLNLLAITKYLSGYSLKTLIYSVIFCIPSCMLCKWTFSILNSFCAPIISIGIACAISAISLAILYQTFHFISIKDFLPRKLHSHA